MAQITDIKGSSDKSTYLRLLGKSRHIRQCQQAYKQNNFSHRMFHYEQSAKIQFFSINECANQRMCIFLLPFNRLANILLSDLLIVSNIFQLYFLRTHRMCPNKFPPLHGNTKSQFECEIVQLIVSRISTITIKNTNSKRKVFQQHQQILHHYA